MRYLLVQRQEGEGCDYTIGCGMTYEFVEFDGPIDEAAKHFARQIVLPDGDDEGSTLDDSNSDRIIEEAWLVPADVAFELDLKAVHHAWQKRLQEKLAHEKTAAERKEFERLSKKFKA